MALPHTVSMNDALPDADHEAVDQTRRRLLLAGGRYLAPAVLVSLTLEQTAYAQGSCQPNHCPPVVNNCGPLRMCRPGRDG